MQLTIVRTWALRNSLQMLKSSLSVVPRPRLHYWAGSLTSSSRIALPIRSWKRKCVLCSKARKRSTWSLLTCCPTCLHVSTRQCACIRPLQTVFPVYVLRPVRKFWANIFQQTWVSLAWILHIDVCWRRFEDFCFHSSMGTLPARRVFQRPQHIPPREVPGWSIICRRSSRGIATIPYWTEKLPWKEVSIDLVDRK